MPIENDAIGTASVPLCFIVTPVGMLSYGLDEEKTSAALASLVTTGVPTAIILDSGSTDGGPEKLAIGKMTSPREAYARDLSKLLKLVNKYKVPLIFSSAGGDGTDEHVREIVGIIEEISANEANEDYSLKTVALFSSIEKGIARNRLRAGAVTGCGDCVPDLTEDDIDASAHIVAQMGPEPFVDAMNANPDFDVIVGGRAYDPAPYVGYAAHLAKLPLDDRHSPEVQRQLGGFTHMGKIMECGGICATPKSHGAIATVYRDGSFEITPLDPGARCTPLSVAAHTLYEKARPDILYGPGGYLDLNTATYEQLEDERSVRVRGSMFHFSQERGLPYQVKLEAAKVIGYRTIFMGSIRDPILISQIDVLLERVKEYAAQQHRGQAGNWELDFHTYGKPSEPAQTLSVGDSPEVFLIGEVLASTQELATSVASAAKVAVTHGSYPGQKATSGNFAFGIGGKILIPMGPCAQFCMYHLMDLADGEERLDTTTTTTTTTSSSLSSSSSPNRDRTTASPRNPLFSQAVSLIGRGPRPAPPHHTHTHTPTPTSPASARRIINNNNNNNSLLLLPEPPHHPAPAPLLLPPTALGRHARVVRSKNAGPYEITLDVMFGSAAAFALVRDSGVLDAAAAAAALGLRDDDVVWSGFFAPALAFKITVPRQRRGWGRGKGREKGIGKGMGIPGGGFMEDDVHGAQQHVRLMLLELPRDLVARLEELEEAGL
ncbi:hypothetical protein F4809DRAFT_651336 [Biscogniauxia mediterranea]|nr:hypothetical protein F4809DRAFT_651336 [Biscogniauxia mediterranea]